MSSARTRDDNGQAEALRVRAPRTRLGHHRQMADPDEALAHLKALADNGPGAGADCGGKRSPGGCTHDRTASRAELPG
jgi:hypothetical protein